MLAALTLASAVALRVPIIDNVHPERAAMVRAIAFSVCGCTIVRHHEPIQQPLLVPFLPPYIFFRKDYYPV